MSGGAGAHTPEPWEQSHRRKPNGMYSTEVYCADGQTIATCAWYPRPMDDDGCIGTYREANAQRIVACVNALAGIPTDALPDLMGEVRDVIEGLIAPFNPMKPTVYLPKVEAARTLLAKLPVQP